LHRELGEKEGLGRALINQANLLHYDLRRPGMALEKCKQAAGVLRESAADSDALEQAEWLLDQIAK
jgi:hypothetical protein